MSPAAVEVLESAMERSRSDSLAVCWRRLFSMLRWWVSSGRGLEEFFTLFGFAAGVAFRDDTFRGGALCSLLGLVRRSVSRRVGVNHAGWLDASMVAWFVTGNEAFTKQLFEVASQSVDENTENAGRIWQARYVLNSVRLRHIDLADQIAELELSEGRPLVPISELPAMHGAA